MRTGYKNISYLSCLRNQILIKRISRHQIRRFRSLQPSYRSPRIIIPRETGKRKNIYRITGGIQRPLINVFLITAQHNRSRMRVPMISRDQLLPVYKHKLVKGMGDISKENDRHPRALLNNFHRRNLHGKRHIRLMDFPIAERVHFMACTHKQKISALRHSEASGLKRLRRIRPIQAHRIQSLPVLRVLNYTHNLHTVIFIRIWLPKYKKIVVLARIKPAE